jgi:hypothetical protein
MRTRLFDVNPFAGTKTLFHYDDAAGTFSLETIADVEAAAEVNKARYNDSNRHQIKGDMVLAASIPLVVYEQLMLDGIANDPKAMKRWLNDRENRVFRTHELRV